MQDTNRSASDPNAVPRALGIGILIGGVVMSFVVGSAYYGCEVEHAMHHDGSLHTHNLILEHSHDE